jgi:hypothetical protein
MSKAGLAIVFLVGSMFVLATGPALTAAESPGQAAVKAIKSLAPPEADDGAATKQAVPGSIIEVVATGVAADPDRALVNAYSHAIEQAVGVVVDAETMVRNDQVLTDQVLTYSDGFVQNYKVVRQWQERGLHYVRIRASVTAHKLVEKLKAQNIATREVYGDRWYLQVVHGWEAQQNAVKMFESVLRDGAMDRLLKVEIKGEPEVTERDAVQAKLKVKVVLSFDMDAWKNFRDRLKPRLDMVAKRKTVYSSPAGTPSPPQYRFCYVNYIADENRLSELRRSLPKLAEGSYYEVWLLRDTQDKAFRTFWDVLWVPSAVLEWPVQQLRTPVYQVRVDLLDAQEKPVLSTSVPLGPVFKQIPDHAVEFMGLGESDRTYPTFWFWPLWCHSDGCGFYANPDVVAEPVLTAEVDQLRSIASVRAFVERTPDEKK